MLHNRLLRKENIVSCCIFFVLFVSFAFNAFQVASDYSLRAFRYDDGFILSRLIANEQESYFSYGMLTGFYINYPLYDSDTLRTGIRDNLTVNKVFDDFLRNNIAGKGDYEVYKTSPGGQAMLVSLGQGLFSLSNWNLIILFRFLTVCLCALSFTLFLSWVRLSFGLFCEVVVFVLILLSPWFLLFANNLWWALWSYYMPFSLLLLILNKRYNGKIDLSYNKMLLLICSLVFVKYFFTGAEFITTYLVMIMCPIVFYLYLEQRMKIMRKIRIFLQMSLAAIVGVLIGFVLLCIQIYSLTGKWYAGFAHISSSFYRRSLVNEDDFTLEEVLGNYFFKGNPFDWGFYHQQGGFYIFIILMVVSSLLILLLNKSSEVNLKKKHKALILTSTISLLAPLSWFFIFTQHAYIHTFIDYITWYMPFVLFVFIQIGIMLELLFQYLRKKV